VKKRDWTGARPREDEPAEEQRCPKPRMNTLSAELVECGGAVLGQSGSAVEADPDAELIDRWQAGDPRAFESLVRRHERRVYRLLLRMLGSPEEAEDATQEAFLSLYRHGRRFRRESRFSTFVYRVAVNAALNRRRSLGRSRARERELAERAAAGEDLPSAPRDPERAASGAQVQAQVQEALLRLPSDLRMAVVLYDIEGRAYREIADVLGIPEGTVKSRIHRARNALRELLREFVGHEASGESP